MRIGLIGAGRWGRRYIATLAGIARAELAHLASANHESARLVPASCRISADWRLVAGDTSLDGVILASPPATHAPLALRALDAGVPVLIEKPMALTVRDAQTIAEAASARRKLAMVGHTHVFSAAYRALKRRATDLGALATIRSHAGNQGPVRRDASVLWDWGPHDVALCLDLMGELPVRVQAERAERQQLADGIGEALELSLTFRAGQTAHIHVSNIETGKVRLFEACFEGGTLIYDDLAVDKLRERNGGSSRVLPIDGSMPLANVVEEFLEAIASGAESHPSLGLGAHVVEVLAQCDRMLCK